LPQRRNVFRRSNNLTDEISETRVRLLQVVKNLDEILDNYWVRTFPGGQG
jgi:hypothetical protein